MLKVGKIKFPYTLFYFLCESETTIGSYNNHKRIDLLREGTIYLFNVMTGLSKPKMPVAKFELPVAKYFYRLPPGGVLMVQILSTRGHLVHTLHTRGSQIKTMT